MKLTKNIGMDGWTIAFESRRFHEFMPGTPLAAFGVALLFYRPEYRLSVSVWIPSLQGIGGYSVNIRLCGPRKLSWER